LLQDKTVPRNSTTSCLKQNGWLLSYTT